MNTNKLFELSVLYVEDDKPTNKLISGLLSSKFDKVISAHDGIKALDLYKKNNPDLVITDIILMPEINGFEMLEEIKKLNPNQHAIVTSSFDNIDYMKKCIALQVSGFIQKPINFDHFHLQIDKIITQIKNEKELKQNRQLLDNIFETVNDFIIVVDNEEILTANKSMYNFFNFDSITKFKKNHSCISDFFIEEQGYLSAIVDDKTWIEYIISNTNTQHKVKIKKEEQSYIFVVNIKKFDLDNEGKYILSFSDITEIYNQDRKLKEKDEMLIYQSKQAELGELLSMITHQWKQPLNLISMIASKNLLNFDFIERKTNTKDDFKEIMTQVNYLSQTIDDFKEFLKPTKKYDTLSIIDLIHKVENIVGKSLLNCDIYLEKYIDNIIINTFSKELIQVIINLLNNSKDAFIENNITNRKIKIFANKNNDKLHLIIKDNAGGVKNNILDQIFNQYFTTKKEDTGTGLGLYMAKNIIEKNLLGDIFVENIDNGLATNITIPLTIKNED